MEMLAYQRMEEFLMNRIRQLSNQMNRMNALVFESLNPNEEMPLQIPKSLYHRLTRAEVADETRDPSCEYVVHERSDCQIHQFPSRFF